jgi:hypothetical protein
MELQLCASVVGLHRILSAMDRMAGLPLSQYLNMNQIRTLKKAGPGKDDYLS